MKQRITFYRLDSIWKRRFSKQVSTQTLNIFYSSRVFFALFGLDTEWIARGNPIRNKWTHRAHRMLTVSLRLKWFESQKEFEQCKFRLCAMSISVSPHTDRTYTKYNVKTETSKNLPFSIHFYFCISVQSSFIRSSYAHLTISIILIMSVNISQFITRSKIL